MAKQPTYPPAGSNPMVPPAPPVVIPVVPKGLVIPYSPTGGYARQNVELRLTGPQAEKLRDIASGLLAAEATLADGRLVQDGEQAVKWILEQVK